MRVASLITVLIAIGLAGCRPSSPSDGNVGAVQPASKKTYGREELRTMVMGKTAEQVIALLGKPKDTTDYKPGRLMMYYADITIDPHTGKLGPAIIDLHEYKVTEVAF
jgi:outer membrane protein assembly factor BamE (lipoprotein component of BamABCDE complex)